MTASALFFSKSRGSRFIAILNGFVLEGQMRSCTFSDCDPAHDGTGRFFLDRSTGVIRAELLIIIRPWPWIGRQHLDIGNGHSLHPRV